MNSRMIPRYQGTLVHGGEMQRLVILTATALATLIPAMALSMPGASIETVGVYGDWTSHVLGEGKLRLCYAET